MDQADTLADDTIHRTFWHKLLLACGVAGSILFTVTYFSFGAIAPNYDMMRESISDLDLLPHGWIQSANFIVFGLFTGAFAVGLRKEMEGGLGLTLIPISHVFTAFGLILAGIFTHSYEHTIALVITFVSTLISFLLFARRFAGDARWTGWATYTLLSAVLMIAMLSIFCYTESKHGAYAGVFERLIVVTRLVWISIFTIRLFLGQTLSAHREAIAS